MRPPPRRAAPSSMGSSAPMPAGAVATVPGQPVALVVQDRLCRFYAPGLHGLHRSLSLDPERRRHRLELRLLSVQQQCIRPISETRFSTKNSRLGLRIDSTVGDWKVLGYVETDFLGNAATNVNVASNSDVMRMRVFFVDLKNGQWEFLAGQDWSMMTPNRKGISPIPGDIFFSQDVDTNYQVGSCLGTHTPGSRGLSCDRRVDLRRFRRES